MTKKLAKQVKYDTLYLKIAREVGLMSASKRSQVGAIMVKSDRIISMGWNGTPHGFDNVCENKTGTGLVTKPEVLHAESNCITKIAKSTDSSSESTMYITLSPCFECAKLIIQSNIKRIVYLDEYRDLQGVSLLKKAGISVLKRSIK